MLDQIQRMQAAADGQGDLDFSGVQSRTRKVSNVNGKNYVLHQASGEVGMWLRGVMLKAHRADDPTLLTDAVPTALAKCLYVVNGEIGRAHV